MSGQLNVQALEALNVANRVRTLRAEDKRAIKRESLDPCVILRNPPDYWKKAKLVELLLAMPRIGQLRANRWCMIEGVLPTRQVGQLTERQVLVLSIHLDTWAWKRDNVRRAMEESK